MFVVQGSLKLLWTEGLVLSLLLISVFVWNMSSFQSEVNWSENSCILNSGKKETLFSICAFALTGLELWGV